MRKISRKLMSLLMGASLLGFSTAMAQQSEDEWYDPTDWFDSNNYEYDDSLGLDYSYWDDETDYGIGDQGYGFNDYEYDDNGFGYGDTDWGANDQQWGWNENEWGYDYGDENWGSDDWGYNNDAWGDDDGVGGYGDYDAGYDWGFNRGYGTQSSWQQSGQQNRGSAASSQSGSDSSLGKQCAVSGTLERARNLSMRGRQNKQTRLTVAQVELQDGRDVLVAFKTQPQQRQRQLNLQPGQQIQARGKIGTISGRRVLMADQIRKNGRTFDVRQISSQRSQGTGSPGQFQSGSSSQQPERGQVRGSRRVRSNQGDEHTLLLIQFENGRTALVDLGPNAQF